MAASEALNLQAEGSPATAGPLTVPVAAAPRWPQLIPIAQLLAVVLGVFAIIWNQQQTTDNLRTELKAEISEMRTELKAEISEMRTELKAEISEMRTELKAEIGEVRTELKAEIGGVRTELAELRAEVSENGQRLARIEGSLGIGIPDTAPE